MLVYRASFVNKHFQTSTLSGTTTLSPMGIEHLEFNTEVWCFCLGIAPRVQFIKKSAWLLQMINEEAPPVACDGSEVVRT